VGDSPHIKSNARSACRDSHEPSPPCSGAALQKKTCAPAHAFSFFLFLFLYYKYLKINFFIFILKNITTIFVVLEGSGTEQFWGETR